MMLHYLPAAVAAPNERDAKGDAGCAAAGAGSGGAAATWIPPMPIGEADMTEPPVGVIPPTELKGEPARPVPPAVPGKPGAPPDIPPGCIVGIPPLVPPLPNMPMMSPLFPPLLPLAWAAAGGPKGSLPAPPTGESVSLTGVFPKEAKGSAGFIKPELVPP